MSSEDIEKYEQDSRDNSVWYIYVFIISAAVFANELEKQYLESKDREKLIAFHSMSTVFFSMAFLVYVYFALRNFKNYKRKRDMTSLIKLIASIFYITGGALLIYVELMNTLKDLND